MDDSAITKLRVALLLCTSMFCCSASLGQGVERFYSGKQVSLYIGYSAGGGYDTYARVLARHLGKHIPGNPTVVPQNMPGAGSLTLANFLYNIAPKDGTVLGTIGRGLAMEPLLGGTGTRFDATKFTWIGSMNNERADIVIHQGSDQSFVPELYLEPVGGAAAISRWESTVSQSFQAIEERYPGVRLKRCDRHWQVLVPSAYRVGHEAHFSQVTERYLRFLSEGRLPDWEVPNMLAKYYTTTQALLMARDAG